MAEWLRIDQARLGSGGDHKGQFFFLAHDCWLDDDRTGRSRLLAVVKLPDDTESLGLPGPEGSEVPEACRLRLTLVEAERLCRDVNEEFAEGDGWARARVETALKWPAAPVR